MLPGNKVFSDRTDKKGHIVPQEGVDEKEAVYFPDTLRVSSAS